MKREPDEIFTIGYSDKEKKTESFTGTYNLLKEIRKEESKEKRIKLWNLIYLYAVLAGKYFPSLDFLIEK